jgi:hypothetical protein
LALVAIGIASLITVTTNAADTNATSAAKPEKQEKGPPIPLHQIEGNGGVFATLSAYIVNPPRNNEPLGRPSVGFAYVDLGHGRNLEAITVTESPYKRIELGYAYDNFNLGDLPLAIERATPLRVKESTVTLHNFNARFALLQEGEFSQKWLPAITAGAHYKYNNDIASINKELSGTLSAIGINRRQGVDFTLYASKLFTQLPRPVLVNLGGRATKGAQLGLFGFTDDYKFVLEGSVAVLVTDNFILAAEYRQKPNEYKKIPGLVGREDDWITFDAAYVVNKHLTLAAGYGHFGSVLNHQANGVWGITTKWEF